MVQKDDFVSMHSRPLSLPRIPKLGDEPRPVEEVAIEELAAAAQWLLKKEYGMPRENLIRSTARLMGYLRTGENVHERFNQAIDWLVKNKIASDDGNQVTLNGR
jgi:hypothetical protein